MSDLDPPFRKRPHAPVDAPEFFSRPYPSSGSIEEGMDLSRSGQNLQAASDRINHTRGDPAAPYQDPIGWSGGNEAEGYNTGPGFTTSTSTRLEAVSSGSGNVFEALGRWSDVVKLMSANMDRYLSHFFLLPALVYFK
jgi:hypothetical protein